MKISGLLGCVLFACLTVKFIAGYGKQWDLSGRYHMPTTLFSPNGKCFRDGTPIDDISKAIIDRGWEQQYWLVGLSVILTSGVYLVVRHRRMYRRQMEAVDVELRRIHGLPPHDKRRGL